MEIVIRVTLHPYVGTQDAEDIANDIKADIEEFNDEVNFVAYEIRDIE